MIPRPFVPHLAWEPYPDESWHWTLDRWTKDPYPEGHWLKGKIAGDNGDDWDGTVETTDHKHVYETKAWVRVK